MEMPKTKVEPLEDGNANAYGQMLNAENDQMKNAAENAANQMPNEVRNVADEMPNVVEANNDGQMPNEAQNVDGGQMLNNAEIADQMPNGNEAIAPVEKEEVANRRKIYNCSKCPAHFRSIPGLKGHEAIHKRRGNPEYPINCQHCDASFDKNRALCAHKWVHAKTQPKAKVGRGRPSTKRARPQANNNDGAEEDDELEIIEPIKQELVGPRRVRFPRAANNELAQNAVGPSAAAGPSSISSILKECAKSHSFTIHNVNAVDGTMGKIEFKCKPGPSSSR